MSAHVLLNLFNELGKKIRYEAVPSFLLVFPNEFNSELCSTCETGRFKAAKAALKEAGSMVENRSNQIQYDFYL